MHDYPLRADHDDERAIDAAIANCWSVLEPTASQIAAIEAHSRLAQAIRHAHEAADGAEAGQQSQQTAQQPQPAAQPDVLETDRRI